MDILLLAKIKIGSKTEYFLINIEHQSTKLNPEKIKIIDDYKNYSKCKYKLPLLSVVVSPYPKDEQEHTYKSTESDILQPVFICIDGKEIQKRLNILKAHINNKEIENHIILNIAIISIFVSNKKYDILKELWGIINNAVGITGEIKEDMTIVLENMIKYKLKNEKTKTMELLNMIEKDTKSAQQGLRIFFEDEFDEMEEKINRKDEELNKKDKELNMKDEELNKKDEEINRQKEIIEDLRMQIKTNSIF